MSVKRWQGEEEKERKRTWSDGFSGNGKTDKVTISISDAMQTVVWTSTEPDLPTSQVPDTFDMRKLHESIQSPVVADSQQLPQEAQETFYRLRTAAVALNQCSTKDSLAIAMEYYTLGKPPVRPSLVLPPRNEMADAATVPQFP